MILCLQEKGDKETEDRPLSPGRTDLICMMQSL